MAGFSSVTGLESIMYADNASFDGTSRGGAMTTDGQIWIGSTAGRHVRLGTLSAGAGISIVNGSGSITIASASAGFTWNNVSGAYSALAENGYRSLNLSAVGTLPAASGPDGTTIKFEANGAAIHQITPSTADMIQISSSISRTGTGGGYIQSTAAGDSLELVYRNSTNTWVAQSVIGNWLVN